MRGVCTVIGVGRGELSYSPSTHRHRLSRVAGRGARRPRATALRAAPPIRAPGAAPTDAPTDVSGQCNRYEGDPCAISPLANSIFNTRSMYRGESSGLEHVFQGVYDVMRTGTPTALETFMASASPRSARGVAGEPRRHAACGSHNGGSVPWAVGRPAGLQTPPGALRREAERAAARRALPDLAPAETRDWPRFGDAQRGDAHAGKPFGERARGASAASAGRQRGSQPSASSAAREKSAALLDASEEAWLAAFRTARRLGGGALS